MRILLLILCLLPLSAAAAPPNGWPADFSATVTLTGTTQREHFVWQATAWRNDPEPLWDLLLLPPDSLAAFVLTDLNSPGPNVALYLGERGQFFVFDPANNIQNASPALGVPDPSMLWIGLAVVTLRTRSKR